VQIYGLDITANGAELLSAGQDGNLILWNAFTGKMRKMVVLESQWALTCAISSTGAFAAAGGMSNYVSVFDLKSDEGSATEGVIEETTDCQMTGHDSAVFHTAFVPSATVGADNGGKLLSSSGDGTLKLWDTEAKKDLQTFAGHQADVSSFEFFTPDTFASISTDATVKIWDARQPATATKTYGACRIVGDFVECLDIFPDAGNPAFATGSAFGETTLWDLRMTAPVSQYGSPELWDMNLRRKPTDPEVQVGCNAVQFSISGRVLFASYYNRNDETQPGQYVTHRFELPFGVVWLAHTTRVNHVFSSFAPALVRARACVFVRA
jgi:guanine nucleotide-binding protein G(I)/G(S)/G(T) subunit beta-1